MKKRSASPFKSLALISLMIAVLWQVSSKPVYAGEIRILPLPGKLDATPVFNSNCPEVVLGEGILLSTMSKAGKKHPGAHLEYSFKENFDVFMHHIADGKKSGHMEDLYVGLVAHNASDKALNLKILNAASYLSQPDAPFIKLKTKLNNTGGNIYAGPGDRVAMNHLLDIKQPGWPVELTIEKGEFKLIRASKIPVSNLVPPLNGRNTLIKLNSDGQVELAAVALFARKQEDGKFVCPEDGAFINQVKNGELVKPRGLVPSDPKKTGPIKYGRVAGVSIGANWITRSNKPFEIKKIPQTLAFPVSSLKGGTFGLKQIETAPVTRRYPDTAYAAHGNYGVLYDIKIPVRNDTSKPVKVNLSFDSPLKTDEPSLNYMNPTSTMTFFRGTVVSSNGENEEVSHLVLHRGEKGPLLHSFKLEAGQIAQVTFKLVYPADSTPPQVISLSFNEYDEPQ